MQGNMLVQQISAGTDGETVLSVEIDGGVSQECQVIKQAPVKYPIAAAAWKKAHTAKITVKRVAYCVDGMEVVGGNVPYPMKEEVI